ncbi:energy transducer TonB [Hellea sp.]|nr:energy transducer TonB [Hellea sp.]
MRLVFITLLTVLILPLLLAVTAHAQSIWLTNHLAENYKGFEDSVRLQLRDFEIVKEPRQFAERFNDNESVEIKSDPIGAIATLHDISTGEALETCKTPCDLHINRVEEYILVLYKFAHEPVIFPIGFGDEIGTVWLGANYQEIEQKHLSCYLEFLGRDKKDTDAEVCLRTPPIMPSDAQKSGHCNVEFDVSVEGRPINIKTTYCTEELFSRPSIQSVGWWFYYPKVERGMAVERSGVTNKITFKLADESGQIIPE